MDQEHLQEHYLHACDIGQFSHVVLPVQYALGHLIVLVLLWFWAGYLRIQEAVIIRITFDSIVHPAISHKHHITAVLVDYKPVS